MSGRGRETWRWDGVRSSETPSWASSRFLGVHRNKRSVTLDLRNPTCKRAFENLVANSDVLLDNWGVAASQRGRYQGQHLVSRIRPPRRICEVNLVVDEFTQTQVLGEGDRKEHPSIGHQAVVVEGDLNAVEGSRGSTYSVRLISVRFWNSKTIIPEAQEHFPAYPPCCNTSSIGGLGLKQQLQGSHKLTIQSGECIAWSVLQVKISHGESSR